MQNKQNNTGEPQGAENTYRDQYISTVSDSFQRAHIAELQRQNAALLAENAKLKAKLALWPGKALDHALEARESERKRLKTTGK